MLIFFPAQRFALCRKWGNTGAMPPYSPISRSVCEAYAPGIKKNVDSAGISLKSDYIERVIERWNYD
ncbi:MAG: hypothetical protein CVV49_10585 [Spirochaetae bacterium HGW-Spirochaetae-5]|nr:MAG: hypothetical protein CVV49_10585 [Spirochaetae bacterium HGW-Spirochaetae-5]